MFKRCGNVFAHLHKVNTHICSLLYYKTLTHVNRCSDGAFRYIVFDIFLAFYAQYVISRTKTFNEKKS